MSIEAWVFLFVAVISPIAAVAFAFGLMRGQFKAIKDKLDFLCNGLTRAHERIDGHLGSHSNPGSGNPGSKSKKKTNRFRKPL